VTATTFRVASDEKDRLLALRAMPPASRASEVRTHARNVRSFASVKR
jgi:hypothetical protein